MQVTRVTFCFMLLRTVKKKKEKAVSSLEIIIPVAEKSYCLENKI